MKRLLPFLMVASVLLLFGCGPKMASKETLDALTRVKEAAESAEAKAKQLEAERIRLESEKAEKEAKVKQLQAELAALKGGK